MANASVCLERSNGVSFQYISMSTTMRMMFLFIRSSRIGRENVGNNFFQKSPFWSIYTETQPRSFQTKMGSAAFSKVSVFDLENARVV